VRWGGDHTSSAFVSPLQFAGPFPLLLKHHVYQCLSLRQRQMGSVLRQRYVPKSSILNTPGTLELALRLAGSLSFGLDERPCTAESTLERGAGPASADMMAGRWVVGLARVSKLELLDILRGDT